MKIIGIIPARYGSSRFPGKPLATIMGKPLIRHVVDRCRNTTLLSDIVVATDDDRISRVVREFCRVENTSADHPSGTDRVAEVMRRLDCDAVVNIQGDEPLIDPQVVDAVARLLDESEMSTAAAPLLAEEDYENANVVKVVVNSSRKALYFSRRTIPYLRDCEGKPIKDQLALYPFLKHLGLYGYRRETLLRLVSLPVSPLERAEKLEQLRALENGIDIAVLTVNYSGQGVDVPGDVKRVERLMRMMESL